jgi:hypothetical protein
MRLNESLGWKQVLLPPVSVFLRYYFGNDIWFVYYTRKMKVLIISTNHLIEMKKDNTIHMYVYVCIM